MLVQLCLRDAQLLHATVSSVIIQESEQFASALPKRFTEEDVLQLLTLLPSEDALYPTVPDGSCFTTSAYPMLLRFCVFFREALPKHKFTVVMLAWNQVTLTRRDSFIEPHRGGPCMGPDCEWPCLDSLHVEECQ